VIVEADDNIVPLITTEIHGKDLVISTDTSISTRSPIKVKIKTPSLAALVINGSSNAVINGASGESFSGVINGSGKILVTGKVNSVNGTINGSGDLAFGGLSVSKASIAITGSGKANVDSSDSLQATITGSGDILYKPGPNLSIQKQVVGSGSVRPI
jgi:hypothetical protein